MKIAFKLVMVLMLGACANESSEISANNDREIVATEQSFREKVVGKEWRFDTGEKILFEEDMTLSGVDNGQPLTGEWYWEDRFACWRYTSGQRNTFDCRVIEVTEDQLFYTRDRGRGSSIPLDLVIAG